MPHEATGDLNAQVSACTIGERGLQDLAARYGAERLDHVMAGLLDHTELLLRQQISRWPDGTATFTDYMDSDGIDVCDVPITVHLTIAGDEIIADFSDSAPMVRGALNCTPSFVEASVYQTVMAACEVDIPRTAGALRPITVITKPGTVTHVVMPGASSMRGITGYRVSDAMNGALAQLVPDRAPAAGEGGSTLAFFSGRHEGEPFVYSELVVGTGGARPVADGNDGLANPCASMANIPIEVAESDWPILIERYGLVPDSGGAGRYRGGLAIERVWRVMVPGTLLQVRSDRQVHRPYGLAGGQPGAASSNLILRADGSIERLPPMFGAALEPGDVFHHRMPAGGGWGDPLDREPEAVADDVREDKISRGAAASSTASSSTSTATSMSRRPRSCVSRPGPPGRACGREGGARRGDAARDSARAGVPLVRRDAARCEPRPFLGAHGRWGDRLRRVDLRGPGRGRLLRPADGGSLRRARARERRGDAARCLDAGPVALLAAVHPAHRVRHRGGLLGRARPDARRPDNVFFGGRVRDEVDFFGFVQGDTAEQLGVHARELASLGHEVLYVKLGRTARDDEECVAAIREAIGPDRLLRIDPNEAWSVGEAVERIRRLEPFGIDWVEQPVPAGNVKGLAHVRRSVGTKIAADQAVFTTRQLLEVLREEAADVVVQGAHDAGGLLPFRQQATIAAAHGVDVNRHAFMETEVSFLANLQVASTIPNLTTGNQAMHQLLAERLVKEPLPLLEAGRARVPETPGHGFEIDLDAVGVAHERWQRDGPYSTREGT